MMSTAKDGGSVRNVVLASADADLRQRLRVSLSGMRWQVREAGGGAEAMAHMEEQRPEALLIDNWLPDLEVGEFAGWVRQQFPGVDLLRLDGGSTEREGFARSPRRHELLHALREAQDASPLPTEQAHDGAVWATAAVAVPRVPLAAGTVREPALENNVALPPVVRMQAAGVDESSVVLPGMIGRTPAMLELARLIRLVAPLSTTVLIEGETGTGKEVVAKALHRLSTRSAKPFAVLNCAAIPEALLEAELFGHTRGAFTGAVSSRTGRIEAAHGGTLFLDEIGEMPLPLQAKLLRFLECGELQRVGDNEVMRVDVRVIAATHQLLEKRAGEGTFRLDLFHRLAVFPIEVPALRDRKADLALLAEHFLAELGREMPRKRLADAVLAELERHDWPGNVRELAHVLERGAILAGESGEIGLEHLRLRRVTR